MNLNLTRLALYFNNSSPFPETLKNISLITPQIYKLMQKEVEF